MSCIVCVNTIVDKCQKMPFLSSKFRVNLSNTILFLTTYYWVKKTDNVGTNDYVLVWREK